MKKSLLGGVSLAVLALASGAQAAPPPPVWNWTGFYVGGNVGVVGTGTSIEDAPGSSFFGAPFTNNGAAAIAGLEAGFNWQFNRLVVGLEGDASFSTLNNSTNVFGTPFTSKLNALGTFRGRVGWAFDRALIYGTGGVAFASLKDEYNPASGSGPFSPNSTVTGWTAGGGFEFVVTEHWTAKAEYLHVAFPDRPVSGSVFGIPYTFNFKDSLDIARVGANYKF